MANGESMKHFNIFAAGLTLTISAYGQTSQVDPWQPSADDEKQSVYHPEPILFIHGINDNDATWGEVAIPSLKAAFSQYDLPVTASNNLIGARTNLNARQEAYLHTFNYGNNVKASLPANAQAFDHIEWNTWEADKLGTTFTNIFWRPTNTNRQSVFQTPPDPTFLQTAPNDDRMTLESRIKQERSAYANDPLNSDTWPKIVLVAHSMGGLLSHYYLCKCTEASIDSGVRRLVTLGSPHQGSGFANWVLWDHSCGIFTRIFDTVTHHPVGNVLSYAGRPSQVGGALLTYGYYAYPGNGALEDISRNLPNEPSKLQHHNELMDLFWNKPVPTIEYVFNVYAAYITSLKYKWAVEFSVEDQGLTDEQRYGDGVVAQRSAAGKTAEMEPSVFRDQDPVIFGTWQHTDHSHEPKHIQSIFQSLFGVPYQWPDSSSTVLPPALPATPPAWTQTYNENQSFSKGLAVVDGNGTHSDEPGIGQLILLCQGSHANPFVVRALNTWTNDGTNYPRNAFTNRSDLTDYQIIGDASASIRSLVLVGAKNHAQSPIASATNGMHNYYWAQDGNEYLPASLDVRLAHDSLPDFGSVSPTNISSRLTSKCLAWQNTNGEFRQYALFENSDFVPLTSNSAPFYYFARGTNLAGLHTPVAERGFDVPVDSATMVNFLCAFNAGEKANGSTQTQWTQDVTEWIDIPAGATNITLNFVPEHNPSTAGCRMEDAFTGTGYYGWNGYDKGSHTFTIPPVDAPRCLQVFYSAYVGGLDDSFVYYDHDEEPSAVVPALTPNALAGIPLIAPPL